jgi:CRISPR system Cascade subunit CasB
VDNKKHRAWPALNRLGIAIKDDDSAYTAGFFATHPQETAKGNFGTTCKAIENKRGEAAGSDNKLTPTERRFQHLLAAEKSEIYTRILRMVRMAKSQDVPINYEQLASDLKFWSDRTKTEWAAAFWTQSMADVSEEDI